MSKMIERWTDRPKMLDVSGDLTSDASCFGRQSISGTQLRSLAYSGERAIAFQLHVSVSTLGCIWARSLLSTVCLCRPAAAKPTQLAVTQVAPEPEILE